MDEGRPPLSTTILSLIMDLSKVFYGYQFTVPYALATVVMGTTVGGLATEAFQPSQFTTTYANTIDVMDHTTLGDVLFTVDDSWELMEMVRDEAAPVLKSIF